MQTKTLRCNATYDQKVKCLKVEELDKRAAMLERVSHSISMLVQSVYVCHCIESYFGLQVS